jgi:Ca2+-binding RTX toxin-like protein
MEDRICCQYDDLRKPVDYLTGGASGDTFRFDVSTLGVDTITDWQDGVDTISIGALVET